MTASETFEPITIQAGEHGTLRGVNILSDGKVKARRFCAVPFARPPVGELRWRKPVPLPDDYDWSDIAGESWGHVIAQPRYEITNDKGETINMDVPGATMSEDGLTANIWTPAGAPPTGGWPVFVFIHGGWLQIGNPGMTDKTNPTDLVASALQCVVIQPAYRLSLFGFLAGKEIQDENEDGTAGNFGFWDQRPAIEWAAKNAHIFGGNGENLTIGGLSAGSYSAEIQLAHELVSGARPVIRRAMMWSNALPAQPKTVEESQEAFDGLLTACGIPLTLDSKEKMQRLRAVPTEELRAKIMKLKIHTFRAVTDDAFISASMYASLDSGAFAKSFTERNMSLIIGEVTAEELMYGATNPPKSPQDLSTQLLNYYRADQVEKITTAFKVPANPDPKQLQALFGDIVAHGQVYITSRHLVRSLLDGGVPAERILRYRVAWKPQAARDESLWPEGVTHADDQPLWWYLTRMGYTPQEEDICRAWLRPVQTFLDGGDVAQEWYEGEVPRDGRRMREIRDGKISVVDDDRWETCERLAGEIAV